MNVDGRRRSNLIWVLVLVAIVLIWWWWRAQSSSGPSDDEIVAGDPDDILIDLVDDAGDWAVVDIESDLGVDLALVSDESLDERLYRAHVDPAKRDVILARLANRDDVETAEPDAEYTVSSDREPASRGFPNDPEYKHQWHLRQIGMPEAWKLANGKGLIVAVIDTGVAFENYRQFHRVPDLAGTRFARGYNFVANNDHPNDDHGHGTHVAGTIAQSTNNAVGVAGVAYDATIMPLKVLSANGSGSVAAIADAVRFATDNGAKVINMSLGGRFPSKILERAVRYAHDKGVVVVCAAGNDGRGKVSYPAAYPFAIAVAATQYDEQTTFYSNWGNEIDVAAPGGNTQVDQDKDGRPDGVLQNTIVVGDPTHDGYFAFMGTSMASPHVAGVAALLMSQGLSSPSAVERVLKSAARTPKGGKVDRARYGAGIVDAPAAIRKAKTAPGSMQLGLGLIIGAAVAVRARKRWVAPGFLAGVLVGSSGLFFWPSLATHTGSVLVQGLPSWDLSFLGPAGHGNPFFFSALGPLLFVAIGYGVPRFRALLAGLSAGVAAHLLFCAAANVTDIAWIPFDDLWLFGQAGLSVLLANLVLSDP